MKANGVAIKNFLDSVKEHAERYALAIDTAGKLHVVCRGFEDETSQEMADRFWERADKRADMAEGAVLAFTVAAYDDDRQIIDAYTFQLGDEVGADELPSLTAELPGTPAGITAASMRAVTKREAISLKLLDASARQARATIGQQAKRVEQLEIQLDRLRHEAQKQIKTREKLKSKAHKRRLRQLEAEESSIFKHWIMEQFVDAAPIVLDHFRGGSQLKRFLGKISEAQFVRMAAVLDKDQQGLLRELVESVDKAGDAHARLGKGIVAHAKTTKNARQESEAAPDA